MNPLRLLSLTCFALASVVRSAGILEVRAPGYAFRDADYSTSHVYVDEVAGSTADIEILYNLTAFSNVTDVEVFTNLNRRDLARQDKNLDNYPDGIVPVPGNDITDAPGDTDPETGHYYRVHNMTDLDNNGIWELTIPAAKTGAYRLTARFKTSDSISDNGFDPGQWIWWGKRDHAIVVAPTISRDVQLYVMNVFNVEASGDSFAQRSTLEDLHNAPGAPHNDSNRWDLDYLLNLGMNWLWFQPIHPNGIDGREPSGGYDTATAPYDPGSPYAVKNFFAVNSLMSVNYDGSKNQYNGNAIDPTMHPDNRAAAMTAFKNFAAAADTKGVGLMLDAPFNHTAFDVELGQVGVDLFQPDGQTWDPLDEIRNREARFFSKDGNYGNRATSASDIAAGPDRFDFGKWRDVKDVFFGRYDALVEFDSEPERSSYTSEGDWFDFSDEDWTRTDFVQDGKSWNVTRRVWDYFAEYAVHWLNETRPAGQNRNSETEAGLTQAERYAWDARGIDGLRCDFGQGLPPRAWEYIINVARSHKWSFVMMSESLDGGSVTYRSSRHFEILNENIVFPLKNAGNRQQYIDIFEGRRNAYGLALVLANTTSHDEANYSDPWQALVRNAAAGMIDSASLIFPGQELGIVTDDKGNNDASDDYNFGYDQYEINFGKSIPHFKRWNSMMPLWNDTNYGNDQLYPVYAGIQSARRASPALRSPQRWFLNGDGGNTQILAAAKYETPNASPATQDVVLAFTNIDRNNTQSDNYKIPATLAGLLGLQDTRTYNVKNMAAYLNDSIGMSGRRDQWLWGSGFTGSELKTNGFFVQLYKVPTANSGWADEPYEAQYLKVYDVTAPTAAPGKPVAPKPFNYELGNSVIFGWDAVPADAGGVVPHYEVTVTVNGSVADTEVVTDPQYQYTGAFGDEVRITVQAVNPDAPGNRGPAGVASETITLLDPDGDEDLDRQSNANEEKSGTNPLDSASVFEIINPEMSGESLTFTIRVVPGYYYTVQSSTNLTESHGWSTEDEVNAENYQAGVEETSYTYTDLNPGSVPKFYRVLVNGSIP